MAITPIDLQTVFSQVDKVARTQIAAKDAQTLHQSIQGVQIQKKLEESIQQVNEAQNTGEGADKVKDRHGNQDNHQGGGSKKEKDNNEDGEDSRLSVLKDPSLGNKIDISL